MDIQNKMLKNFVDKYGVCGLKRITSMFTKRESNQAIANEFGVTRQRVHQWQKVFVTTKVTPRLHVKKIIGIEVRLS